MLSMFKNHPFSVEAFFQRSVVLTFAVPKESLAALIPKSLELDVFDNKWAFLAVAMVQTKDLRPKGVPKILGNDFFLIGYRVFVKYTTSYGKRLRGLYILKSETDSKKMQIGGNIFTHYNYTTTDINQIRQERSEVIYSKKSDFQLTYQLDENITELPEYSPFLNWKQARRYAGPLPFTFTYNSHSKEVLIIEGVRKNWKPKPIKIIDYNFSFIRDLELKEAKLANAFVIENIPYYWKKGKIDLWK